MVESQIQRERKAALSAWLCDRFGGQFDIEPFFWRDAEDLIKFLRANGLEIRPCQEVENAP